MIFASNEKKPIGTICTAVRMTNTEGDQIKPQPICILRESTREAYLKQTLENMAQPASETNFPYYYEVSTD